MVKHLGWLLLVLSALSAQDKPTAQESLYTKAPADWRAEIIPFPLGFAPDIALKGVEELRFAPGMFKTDQTDYFTYSFIWWLEGDVAFDVPMLEDNLKRYYDGLYKAVSKLEKKDLSSFKYTVKSQDKPGWFPKASEHFTAGITWIDPFTTENPVVLHVRIARWYCKDKDRTAGYFMVSPQPVDHALWGTMAAMEAGGCL